MQPSLDQGTIIPFHSRTNSLARSSKGCVVVVDDEGPIRSVISRILCRAGYDVVDAPTLTLISTIFPDLEARVLILDMILPNQEMTAGFSAARCLFPNAKLVAISGGGRTGPNSLLSIATRMGADATIAKPFSLAHLLSVVGAVAS